jgi:lambda family phage holin
MPEKDPMTWATIWHALPATVQAAIIGVFVAFLRVMYDDREPSMIRRLLECSLCGAIALCVASLSEAAGFGGQFATFVGGSVGLLGADQVRIWARTLAQRRVDDIGGPKP